MKLLSIIIPTYRPKNYIFECLDSIKNQYINNQDYEILIILNGCYEPYYTQLSTYERKCGMDIVLIHTVTSGVSHARNLGIKLAKGRYIHFIDDDDVLLPGLYNELNKELYKDEYDLISFGFNREFKNGKIQENIPNTTQKYFFKDYSIGKIRTHICASFFKRDFLQNNNLSFDENTFYSEDINFLLNAHLISRKTKFVKKTFYLYRYNAFSAINKPFEKKRLSSFYIQETFLKKIKSKVYYNDFLCLLMLSIILNYRRYLKSKNYSDEVNSVFMNYFDKYFSNRIYLKANKRSIFVFLCWLLWRFNKNIFYSLLKRI